jgi:hypothetical protein
MSESSYNGNRLLRHAGIPINFTEEQVKEWIKCRDDPVYFASNYVKIVTLDHGLQPMNPYDFQKEIIEKAIKGRRLIVKTARQNGKCVEKSTIYKVRNKKTGEVLELTAEEFHGLVKYQEMLKLSKDS